MAQSLSSQLFKKHICVAISQRDTNFYEFWNEPNTQAKASSAIQDFWRINILPKWTSSEDCKKSSAFFSLDRYLTSWISQISSTFSSHEIFRKGISSILIRMHLRPILYSSHTRNFEISSVQVLVYLY